MRVSRSMASCGRRGVWLVISLLCNGQARVVQRARQEDLNQAIRYGGQDVVCCLKRASRVLLSCESPAAACSACLQCMSHPTLNARTAAAAALSECAVRERLPWLRAGVRWIRNTQGQPVIDRAYNMVQLLNMYMGRSPIADEDVSWDVANPNQLSVRLRGAHSESPTFRVCTLLHRQFHQQAWRRQVSQVLHTVPGTWVQVSAANRGSDAGGTRADTRVTRRSEDQVADGEYWQRLMRSSCVVVSLRS